METGFLHNYGNTDSVVNNDTERQPCKLNVRILRKRIENEEVEGGGIIFF